MRDQKSEREHNMHDKHRPQQHADGDYGLLGLGLGIRIRVTVRVRVRVRVRVGVTIRQRFRGI